MKGVLCNIEAIADHATAQSTDYELSELQRISDALESAQRRIEKRITQQVRRGINASKGAA